MCRGRIPTLRDRRWETSQHAQTKEVSGSYSRLQIMAVGSNALDDADAFMAEDHVRRAVVHVGVAEARVGDFDEDIVVLQDPVRLTLEDLAVLGAFVDGEFGRHGARRVE